MQDSNCQFWSSIIEGHSGRVYTFQHEIHNAVFVAGGASTSSVVISKSLHQAHLLFTIDDIFPLPGESEEVSEVFPYVHFRDGYQQT